MTNNIITPFSKKVSRGPNTIYTTTRLFFSLGSELLENSLKSLGTYCSPNCLRSRDGWVRFPSSLSPWSAFRSVHNPTVPSPLCSRGEVYTPFAFSSSLTCSPYLSGLFHGPTKVRCGTHKGPLLLYVNLLKNFFQQINSSLLTGTYCI